MLSFFKKILSEIATALNNMNSNFETLISQDKQRIEFQKQRVEDHIDEMINRFYKVFELHNIGINEIPIVIDKKFEISLFDISNKENLLKKINNDLIEWLADFFYINIDWLLCKTDYMYSQHNYDKDIVGLGKFINDLSKRYHFSIEALKSSDLNNNVVYGSDDGQHIYPFIIIQEQIGTVSISKYILLNSYMWSYPRTRRDFKAITYLLYHGWINYYKSRIYILGFDFDINEAKYNDFLKGNCSYRDLKKRYSVSWYPDDYIEAKGQSAVSKETKEYDDLMTYISENKYCVCISEYSDTWISRHPDSDLVEGIVLAL